MYNKIVKALL